MTPEQLNEARAVWQPIETAPSEWVLLWTKRGWQIGFRLSTGEWHIEGDELGTPTHWMPLPAPPTILQEHPNG